MGLVCPELSLDLKPSFVPETINGFFREVSMIGDVSERLEKVDDFVRRLEEEMKKIEVFKRELPLCMLLLKDAIRVLKLESSQHKTINAHQPVLEEFISLNKESSGEKTIKINNKPDEEESSADKKNWMSSVQLWSADNHNQSQNLVSESKQGGDKTTKFVGDDLHNPCKINPCKTKTGSMGFVPMIHDYPTIPELRKKVVEKEDVSVPGLSLFIPGIKHPKPETSSRGLDSKIGGIRVSSSSSPASNGQPNLRPGQQQLAARKQRRCWSPELHRRFVDALTQLGGPQVATPKQIRELMRVDGLTNDEVKSHLQKYRLHTQRVPNNNPANSTSENDNRLAGSWATQDQCSESSKPSSSQSGSPQGPHQFPALTGGTSTTGFDSMEDEDEDENDEKSESYSWKGHLHRPRKDDI